MAVVRTHRTIDNGGADIVASAAEKYATEAGYRVVIAVVDDQSGVAPPMLIAGAVFALLAALLVLSATRLVPLAGAALQVLVLAGYILISSERTPAYEAWGITVKALQVLLLIAFVYLALQHRPRTEPRPTDERTLSSA